MNFPKELLYNKEYSWVRVIKGYAEVGVNEQLTSSVKEIVFVELPKKNRTIKKGDIYLSLESVKWSGHLPSPVSGVIVEVNEELLDQPSLINKRPYKSWVMRVKLSNTGELRELLDAEQVMIQLCCPLKTNKGDGNG